jgi:hypothetical protein
MYTFVYIYFWPLSIFFARELVGLVELDPPYVFASGDFLRRRARYICVGLGFQTEHVGHVHEP